MKGGLPFLVLAYSVVYAAIAAYALFLGRRERALGDEIREIKNQMKGQQARSKEIS